MPSITGVIAAGTVLQSPASLPVATRIATVTSLGVIEVTVATSDFDAAGTAAGLVSAEAATRSAADAVLTSEVGTKLDASAVGVSGGVAPLDSGGKVPAAYLPSFVDDVIEAANFAALPVTGATGVIYVTLNDNKAYRWSGSAYVEISASPGSTDAVTEGSTNLYFTAARVRAVVLTGLSLATNQAIAATDTVLAALGYLGARVDALWSRSISTSTGLSGGGDLSADRTLSLANTAVTAGSYTSANITVDAQGRLTAAANGSGASPAGSTKQLQFNSAGSFGGAAGFEYQSGATPNVLIASQNAAYTALRLKEAASPSVSPLQGVTSADVVTFFVPPGGRGFGHYNGSSWYGHVTFVDPGGVTDHPSVGLTAAVSAGVPTNFCFLFANSMVAPVFTGGLGTSTGDTLHSSSPKLFSILGTSGNGTNIASLGVKFGTGQSTGSATPATHTFQTTTVGSSGSTKQTLRDVLQLDGNTTSGETPLLLLDLAAGTMKRVSIGAADSGGAGFKVLRVPN